MFRSLLIFEAALSLAACRSGPASPSAEASARHTPPAVPIVREVPGQPPVTRVIDPAMSLKLLHNSGITLQWISWDVRGELNARREGERIYLDGSQAGRNGGTLDLSGHAMEIGADYFIFDGKIAIRDTPDPGRDCLREGRMRFAITQNRKYWRLQDMEACGDGLTDYVDIYF